MDLRRWLRWLGAATALALALAAQAAEARTYEVACGARPHDVAPDPRPGGPVWHTARGQGALGRLDPQTGTVEVRDSPRGRGPCGIATMPIGEVYCASLAGDHIARIDLATGAVKVIEPPTPDQGARRVWPDSKGRVWVSEWNSGQVDVCDLASKGWRTWKLPGSSTRAYSLWVDEAWGAESGADRLVVARY